jgi:predicted Fe-Mo cluster-binding NifX family protein
MMKIAIPVTHNAGLNSEVSSHFGRAPGFFIVTRDGSSAEYLDSREQREASECAPITALAKAGVVMVAARSMGRGALNRCHQAGIQIYHTEAERVVDLLAVFESGQLRDFPDSALCSHGSGHGRNHGDHCHEHHE